LTYQAQSQLNNDPEFQQRCTACATEQAETYRNDQRPDFVALAEAVLKGDGNVLAAFVRIEASAPGIADKADLGDGSIDQSKVTDADLLSLTQANWQVVADLFFNTDGSAKP